jgi:hypothetical protein
MPGEGRHRSRLTQTLYERPSRIGSTENEERCEQNDGACQTPASQLLSPREPLVERAPVIFQREAVIVSVFGVGNLAI